MQRIKLLTVGILSVFLVLLSGGFFSNATATPSPQEGLCPLWEESIPTSQWVNYESGSYFRLNVFEPGMDITGTIAVQNPYVRDFPSSFNANGGNSVPLFSLPLGTRVRIMGYTLGIDCDVWYRLGWYRGNEKTYGWIPQKDPSNGKLFVEVDEESHMGIF